MVAPTYYVNSALKEKYDYSCRFFELKYCDARTAFVSGLAQSQRSRFLPFLNSEGMIQWMVVVGSIVPGNKLTPSVISVIRLPNCRFYISDFRGSLAIAGLPPALAKLSRCILTVVVAAASEYWTSSCVQS